MSTNSHPHSGSDFLTFVRHFCALMGLGSAAMLVFALATRQHAGLGWLFFSIACSIAVQLICRERNTSRGRHPADSVRGRQ